MQPPDTEPTTIAVVAHGEHAPADAASCPTS